MSNKAIVFYTSVISKAQENSLRQIHGIEDLIFAPIESVTDLETDLLKTTERPFSVYNYLTDNSLVLALCDKLLNFTQQTGYEPEYFIWVGDSGTNKLKESIRKTVLTDKEKSQRTELTAQVRSPEVLHIDASDMSIPPSISHIKDKVEKFAEMQKRKDVKARMTDYDPEAERPDPYLSYGEAIEMCKKGIDVTCVNWRAGEFLTVNTGAVVHADNFWSPGNKRMAMASLDQSLSVFPHFLRTTKYGTVPHMVDFNDQFSEWVVASDRIKVKTVSVDGNKVTLHYALDTFSTAEFELAPFWLAYDVLADLPNNVTVITDNDANVLVHIIASMKEAHDNQRQIVEESFEIYNGRIPEELPNRGVGHYPMSGLNNTIEAIRQGTFTHVIVDSDSFKTDFRLEAIKTALKEAKVNWASISVKEQLFGITE